MAGLAMNQARTAPPTFFERLIKNMAKDETDKNS